MARIRTFPPLTPSQAARCRNLARLLRGLDTLADLADRQAYDLSATVGEPAYPGAATDPAELAQDAKAMSWTLRHLADKLRVEQPNEVAALLGELGDLPEPRRGVITGHFVARLGSPAADRSEFGVA